MYVISFSFWFSYCNAVWCFFWFFLLGFLLHSKCLISLLLKLLRVWFLFGDQFLYNWYFLIWFSWDNSSLVSILKGFLWLFLSIAGFANLVAVVLGTDSAWLVIPWGCIQFKIDVSFVHKTSQVPMAQNCTSAHFCIILAIFCFLNCLGECKMYMVGDRMRKSFKALNHLKLCKNLDVSWKSLGSWKPYLLENSFMRIFLGNLQVLVRHISWKIVLWIWFFLEKGQLALGIYP